MLQQEPINDKIKRKQLECYGHVLRMDTERICKNVFQAKRIKRRGKGKPKKEWMERIARQVKNRKNSAGNENISLKQKQMGTRAITS